MIEIRITEPGSKVGSWWAGVLMPDATQPALFQASTYGDLMRVIDNYLRGKVVGR